jgi:hypothetical protein
LLRGELGLRRVAGLRRHRRRATGRHLARRLVEFVLARGDFRDGGIEARRAQRRRVAIDLLGGALHQLGLALPVLHLRLVGSLRIADLRQPRIEARDRVVELPRHRGLAARCMAIAIAAGCLVAGPGNLFDLAGDRVEPLVDVVDGAVLLAVGGLPRFVAAAEIRGRIADVGIEPVAQRHAGAARGRLGPLAHGWIDAVDTPRYARIHDLVRFRLRRFLRLSLPARPDPGDNRIRRGSSASEIDFFPLG